MLDNDIDEVLSGRGPRFFGEITASISHELKNSLAIVNENAGLLEDMVHLQEKTGKPLNFERLFKLSLDLQRQIDRADSIIKNLNVFAHSVDKAESSIELNEAVEYLLIVSERLIKRNGSKCTFEPTPEKIEINKNYFFFLNLVWVLISKIFNNAEQGIELNLKTGISGEKPFLKFILPEGMNSNTTIAENEKIDYLIGQLGAEISFPASNIIALEF